MRFVYVVFFLFTIGASSFAGPPDGWRSFMLQWGTYPGFNDYYHWVDAPGFPVGGYWRNVDGDWIGTWDGNFYDGINLAFNGSASSDFGQWFYGVGVYGNVSSLGTYSAPANTFQNANVSLSFVDGFASYIPYVNNASCVIYSVSDREASHELSGSTFFFIGFLIYWWGFRPLLRVWFQGGWPL